MRFRCPHCRQKTISLAERVKANGFRPRACPQCGGRNTTASWAVAPVVVLFPLLSIAPLLLAGSALLDWFWLLVAAGLALATAASLLAYLCVPLLRHGSRLARFESLAFLLVVAGVAIYAALKPALPGVPMVAIADPQSLLRPEFVKGTRGRSFLDPRKQAQWKDALAEAKIPYRVERQSDGREFVWIAPQHAAAAAELERRLRAGPVPAAGKKKGPFLTE